VKTPHKEAGEFVQRDRQTNAAYLPRAPPRRRPLPATRAVHASKMPLPLSSAHSEERIVRKTLTAAVVTSVVLLASAGASWAADVCFKDSFLNVLVLKSFIQPSPGNCKTANGFFHDQNYVVSGSACGTNDSATQYIFFNLFTSGGTTTENKLYTFYIQKIGADGGGQNCPLTGAGACSGFAIEKVVCPIPKKFGP
jgi:hypothetical protein